MMYPRAVNHNGIIYVTENLANGKIYVGIHTKGRKDYLGSGTYIHRAIEKWKREHPGHDPHENFVRHDVDEFSTIEEGHGKEQLWIRELNSKHPNGYNLTDGGEGVLNLPPEILARRNTNISKALTGNPKLVGRSPVNKGKHHSEEQRAKMRAHSARRGKPGTFTSRHHSEATRTKLRVASTGKHHSLTEATKAKLRAANLGRHHTAETRAKMSAAQKAFFLSSAGEAAKARLSTACKGKPAWNKGRHHTAETRAKMSAAQKGKPSAMKGKHHSEATKAKLRESHLGVKRGPHSESTRAKISAALTGNPKLLGRVPVNKGKHPTAETRKKISIALKGRFSGPLNPFYGKRHTAETRAELSAKLVGKPSAMKGKQHTEESRLKMRESHLGKPYSEKQKIAHAAAMSREEVREKFRISHIGHIPWNKGKPQGPISEDRKAKMRGHTPWNKGKHFDEATKAKMSVAKKDKPWSLARRAAEERKTL